MISQCFKMSVSMKNSVMAGKLSIFSGFKQAEDSANCGVILQEQFKHYRGKFESEISRNSNAIYFYYQILFKIIFINSYL